MKVINLQVLSKLFRGIADGSLKLVAVPTGKKPRKAVAKAPKKAGKPGRKKKPGRKPTKHQLPDDRQVFLYMNDKHLGVKLSELAREFHLKRNQIQGLLDRLVKKGDLSLSKQKVYFLERRLRKTGVQKEKPTPIPAGKILQYLQKHAPATMAQIAAEFGGGKYQRLIRPMNKLEKEKKVLKKNKEYTLP